MNYSKTSLMMLAYLLFSTSLYGQKDCERSRFTQGVNNLVKYLEEQDKKASARSPFGYLLKNPLEKATLLGLSGLFTASLYANGVGDFEDPIADLFFIIGTTTILTSAGWHCAEKSLT